MSTDPSKYVLNHLSLRVRDPKLSVEFFEKNLGMKLRKEINVADHRLQLNFLSPEAVEAAGHWSNNEGILELCNSTAPEDQDFKAHSGNTDPLGFCHIGFSVDNVDEACERMKANGVEIVKSSKDGWISGNAYIQCADGYYIEISHNGQAPAGENETDKATYRLCHFMYRIKDPEVSLKFYQDVCGMTLLGTLEVPEHGATVYTLGYDQNSVASASGSGKCNLKLLWIHGSESDPNQKHHPGDTDPKGYSHFCITVDDLDAACERLDKAGVEWKYKLGNDLSNDFAMFLDPEGYVIQIIQNETIKKRTDW